jgi:hypothetical protein
MSNDSPAKGRYPNGDGSSMVGTEMGRCSFCEELVIVGHFRSVDSGDGRS